MRSFDTNVAVRRVVVDDVVQCERAAQALRRAVPSRERIPFRHRHDRGRVGPASCLQTGPISDRCRASQTRQYLLALQSGESHGQANH